MLANFFSIRGLEHYLNANAYLAALLRYKNSHNIVINEIKKQQQHEQQKLHNRCKSILLFSYPIMKEKHYC